MKYSFEYKILGAIVIALFVVFISDGIFKFMSAQVRFTLMGLYVVAAARGWYVKVVMRRERKQLLSELHNLVN